MSSRNAYSYALMLWILCGALIAQEPDDTAPPPGSTETLTPILREQSYFTDRVGSYILYFDTIVENPDAQSVETESVSIFEIEVFDTPDSDNSASIAIVRFLPKAAGLATLPPLQFYSESKTYRTQALQFLVDEPTESELLKLEFSSEVQEVYAGQPFAIDMRWNAQLKASAIRNLLLNPAFFSNPDIEIVIPRSTDPEHLQVGLPIGGRRVIGKREADPTSPELLGTIHLRLFLRIETPGTYQLSETQLECSLLKSERGSFGRYAAHFNNGFFEIPESSQQYTRIFTQSNALEIQVKPLPETEHSMPFSGLFEPLEFQVQVNPRSLEIGQMAEVEISVLSEAPYGMIALPHFGSQRGVRSRFLVDRYFARQWQSNGTLFRARFRPLLASINSFPSLAFKTFDPATGEYLIQKTLPIPLDVSPSPDSNFVSIDTFPEASVALTDNDEGIWHNIEPNKMNSLLNLLHTVTQTAFWPLLILGPALFAMFYPLAIESRRQALDPQYRKRKDAYKRFVKAPRNSKQRWEAFIHFLAVRFQMDGKAWTQSDSNTSLKELGAEPADIETIHTLHQKLDQSTFSSSENNTSFDAFEPAAQRIAALALKSSIALLLIFGLNTQSLEASHWDDASALFEKAQTTEAGSESQTSLYQEAALKFEASALENINPGEAWYNAGNAWMQSSELGRAIAAYRQASLFNPFDPKLEDNLAAARALALNKVESQENALQKIPVSWIKMEVLIMNLIYWAVLLGAVRYRNKIFITATTIAGILLFLSSAFLIRTTWRKAPEGTVITESIFAKKGPSYAYANAFNEPLHDGLEFTLKETRESWARIELADTRECWVPVSQIQLIVE